MLYKLILTFAGTNYEIEKIKEAESEDEAITAVLEESRLKLEENMRDSLYVKSCEEFINVQW